MILSFKLSILLNHYIDSSLSSHGARSLPLVSAEPTMAPRPVLVAPSAIAAPSSVGAAAAPTTVVTDVNPTMAIVESRQLYPGQAWAVTLTLLLPVRSTPRKLFQPARLRLVSPPAKAWASHTQAWNMVRSASVEPLS